MPKISIKPIVGQHRRAEPDLHHSTCAVHLLSVKQHAEWNRYVEGHAQGTIFHTLGWRDAVRQVFRHEDLYLTATRHGAIVGVLPLFLVKSQLAGRMLVSVPYGVGGGIIARDAETYAALFDAARQMAEARQCRAIDLRSELASVPNVPTIDRYVGFRREMPENPRDVLSWLPRKARAAARNAGTKFQLTISFGDEHLDTVWRLYTLSMRRLASLAYPLAFFEKLVAYTPDQHLVSLVRWKGRPVAGLVSFLFRDRVLPYFIGTTDDARRCSAANFIYLKAMERGVSDGYRVFDFGRTRRDNTGSFDFKRFNGFSPEPLGYQMFTLSGHSPPDLSPTNPKFRAARYVWPHLPLRVTTTIGARVARHITG
jgi:FemAB-related protein (PEP-CTERM system-associated)